MNKERISIIIPVYNAEDYLARCIDSILDQSFTSYEVILVDDGSTDSSPLICDRYSSSDPRFKTVHKENGGVSSARNAGINLAKGEYLMFIDADDALLPDALERVMEGALSEDIIIGGYAVFTCGVPDKEILPRYTRSYKSGEMQIFFEDNVRRRSNLMDSLWSKLFLRKTIGSLRFNEGLSYAEDKLFVLSFMAKATSAYTCNVPVYAFHYRPDSIGNDISSDRHLMQLRRFLPSYAAVLSVLCDRFPCCSELAGLYHRYVIGRYGIRILAMFGKRRTSLLDKDYIEWIYGMMRKDPDIRLLSFGFGNLLNIILYKIGRPSLSVKVYKLISFFRAS